MYGLKWLAHWGQFPKRVLRQREQGIHLVLGRALNCKREAYLKFVVGGGREREDSGGERGKEGGRAGGLREGGREGGQNHGGREGGQLLVRNGEPERSRVTG